MVARGGMWVTMSLSNLPANAASAFLNLGVSQTSIDLTAIGMEGCSLLTSIATSFQMTLGTGTASQPLAIVNNSSLLGAHLYAQGVVLAPGVNVLGALTSDGGDLRLGN